MTKKTDLRILKTDENIKTAFINLLAVKDFKDITVQNIIEEALIGRSTFYDHYCDKYDLLEKLTNEIITDFNFFIKGRFNIQSHEDFINFFLDVMEYYSKKSNVFLALIKVHTEFVDLYDSLMCIFETECSSYWDRIETTVEPNIPKDYFCRVYPAFAMASIQWGIENSKKCTPQHFLELFDSLKLLIPKLF